MAGSRGGPGGHVGTPPQHIIQARRIEKHENGNSFFGGGGKGGGVRGYRNLGGGSASFKLSTIKDSQKRMIYMQFSYP